MTSLDNIIDKGLKKDRILSEKEKIREDIDIVLEKKMNLREFMLMKLTLQKKT